MKLSAPASPYGNDDEFDRMVKELGMEKPTEFIDPNPYGAPAHPPKAGPTKRGKAALGIGAAVIAGGSLIGYQVHENNQVKAQEIALKAQALELEKMRELNRASEVDRKVRDGAEKARQASIDTCVKSHSDQIGKSFGSPSYRDIVDDCQAQYSGTTSGDDMVAAGSSDGAGNGSGGGVNDGVLIGGGVLLLFLVAAARKGTKSNPA